ncbi:MAG: MotA/TolQ/ExbB proton channel family protein [Candidatus Cloacimonadales bacterium]
MHIYELLNQGGPIMYILLVLNIVGFAIMITKFIKLLLIKRRSAAFIFANILDNIKKRDIHEYDREVRTKLVRDEMDISLHKLESGLTTVRVISTIAPLLGLLGTVIGILSAFKTVSVSGLDDPSSFAGGISMALLTTVGGLIVAIPHNIGYNYIIKIIDGIEVYLEAELLPQVLKLK